jgi:acyl carrier protein
MTISDKIEQVLLTEIAAGLDKKSIAPDEDLLEQSIIDSLGLMKLVDFMERTFDIKIADEQIVPDNFQTLNSMVMLVEQQIKIKSANI